MTTRATIRLLLSALALLAGEAADAAPPIKAADVLVWSPAVRETRLSRMETLLPHRVIRAGGRVHRLPQGRPLAPRLAGGETLDAWMTADRTAGLLVLQDGKVRLERYGPALARTGHWASFSVTKSITSTLFGAAIREGFIHSLDDYVPTYIPEMKGSAYADVTIRQLLTMSSGVRWNEDYSDPGSDVARMYGTPPDPGLDPIVSYMRRLPREVPPGTKWSYKTGETDLAGILLVRATGKPLAEYLSDKIWRPYGMERDAVWMIDAQDHSPGGCCLSASLRDFGRIGQFVLDGGRIGGKPVLADGWLAAATKAQIGIGRPGIDYGFFWWVNSDGTFDARGIFGQTIHIDPKRHLVVVLLAAWATPLDPARMAPRARLMEAIAAGADATP